MSWNFYGVLDTIAGCDKRMSPTSVRDIFQPRYLVGIPNSSRIFLAENCRELGENIVVGAYRKKYSVVIPAMMLPCGVGFEKKFGWN